MPKRRRINSDQGRNYQADSDSNLTPESRQSGSYSQDDDFRSPTSADNSTANQHVMNHYPMDRNTRKISRRFSRGLMMEALSSGWEDEEIARLFICVTNTLSLSNRKLRSPGIISELQERGFDMDSEQLVSLLLSWTDSIPGFLDKINEFLDLTVLSVSTSTLVAEQIKKLELDMTRLDQIHLLRVLCSHSETKAMCGAIIAVFVEDMDPQEAVGLIHDVISYDFFLDLRGQMKHFKRQIPWLRSRLDALLSETKRLDKHGDIIESDADENGNLQGFVVNSEDGSDSNDDESDRDSDSDSDSDRSDNDEERTHSTEGEDLRSGLGSLHSDEDDSNNDGSDGNEGDEDDSNNEDSDNDRSSGHSDQSDDFSDDSDVSSDDPPNGHIRKGIITSDSE